jgi:hypothetical protein
MITTFERRAAEHSKARYVASGLATHALSVFCMLRTRKTGYTGMENGGRPKTSVLQPLETGSETRIQLFTVPAGILRSPQNWLEVAGVR